MMNDNPYIQRAYAAAASRDPGQTVFLQTLETLYESLAPLLEERPLYASHGLLERLGQPELAAVFPVRWRDDRGRAQTARGFAVRYNSALGPYGESLVFRRGLDMSAAKALALESALEHSLAGLSLGGGLVGADVSPDRFSDGESRRFCRGFMEALYPLLPHPFSPAEQWAGQVPRRELGYLTGQAAQLDACLSLSSVPPQTAAAPPFSRSRAAGYGLCTFARCALREYAGIRLDGQTVLVSGAGGPAPWAGEMAARMGASVTAIGDGTGCLYAPEGLPLAVLRDMAAQPGMPLLLWAIRTPGAEYRPGPALWEMSADVIFLCDGGARLDAETARTVGERRPAGIFEGVPGACTARAARIFDRSGCLYSPAIASGAGGAAMACRPQIAAAGRWETERLLRSAMEGIFQTVREECARLGLAGSLAQGARIAAFRRIADAILEKGL